MKKTVASGESVWVSYYDKSGNLIGLITSKDIRDYYYYYEASEDGLKKLGKARTPVELEEKYHISDKIRG